MRHAPAPLSATALRVVPDTNVWLDLLLFGNPDCQGLAQALCEGRALALVNAACAREWRYVLHQPHLALDAAQRAELMRMYALHGQVCEAAPDVAPPVLPRCADRDDQKFLQLAACSQADLLLSKDRALLKLNRKLRDAGWFAVRTPAQWDLAAGQT
ncbi:putative toxin-antitoxin system toxin component, PIN family [Massilia sp. W12]|uniref:putative toxin-antitoxin system toxin component, PIN family n=1 Tax=Massilia sp. W12 TaxID=3126507 RepID=UPI0030D47804